MSKQVQKQRADKLAEMAIEQETPIVSRTPRTNQHLTQKLAEFASLAEGLDYAAKGVTGFNFYSARGQLTEVLSYRTLRERAVAVARRLAGLNLKRGDRVALVAETGSEFVETFFACQYAGLVPCPMPYSMHIGGMDAYVDRIAGMLRAAKARAAGKDVRPDYPFMPPFVGTDQEIEALAGWLASLNAPQAAEVAGVR